MCLCALDLDEEFISDESCLYVISMPEYEGNANKVR